MADLLRINTGIPPTPAAQQQRLGLLTLLDGNNDNDDAAGFPNGRRPDDDVTDIAARAVAGILVNPTTFGTRIGDGVNVNDMPKRRPSPTCRRRTTAATAGTSTDDPAARACARPGCNRPPSGDTTMSICRLVLWRRCGGERDGALRPAAPA